MSVFFLSYRRQDVPDVVGRLHDRIAGRFGADAVFRDVDSLAVGTDFRRGLEAALARTDALLAIIGPRFLKRADSSEPDYVVEEIGRALDRAIVVIPVLAHDTPMPSAAELPERIQSLAYIQATRLRSDPDFGADVEKLLRALVSAATPQPSAGTHATIELVSGPRKGERYAIHKERTLLGRNRSCDIVLDATFASQYHAAILDTPRGLLCEDLGSTNGTFVNGERVSGRVTLSDGDLVHVGNSILRVQLAGAPRTATTTAPARLTLHVAHFVRTGTPCCFLNVTNLSATALELTHVWIEAESPVFPLTPDRPLPKRLEPMESWETWIPLDELPANLRADPALCELGRARLSTGQVLSSVSNDSVPPFGNVPGGPIGTAP